MNITQSRVGATEKEVEIIITYSTKRMAPLVCEYELHRRLKLVRGEKNKIRQMRRPRAVGGVEICILNGLGFITVFRAELAIYAINK